MSQRKIESPEMLIKLWEQYKRKCNNKKVQVHDFSAKNSEFVSAKLKKSVTYTLEGFCVYAGLARKAFYDNYANHPDYAHIVTCMREECEIDAREKFELGVVPSQLAGLWMSRHGYSLKEKTVIASDSTSNIIDALSGKAESVFSEPDEDVENV